MSDPTGLHDEARFGGVETSGFFSPLRNQSFAQLQAHSKPKQESQDIATVLGIVVAMVSVVTTVWDLWEKWNAIIMLQYALREIAESPWTKHVRYQKYDSLAFCLQERIDEAVETLSTVAVYFQLLYYASTQCARPDVQLDWLTPEQRCTRDYAQERVDELYEEFCSARYGRGIFGTADMLLAAENETGHPGCTCLPNHMCEGSSWCWVPSDSQCPDVASDFRGYYSHTPCLSTRMRNPDKARSLLKSACTVCNHGFFSNAGIIQAGFSDGSYGAENQLDIKNQDLRNSLMSRLSLTLSEVYNISVDDLLVSKLIINSDEVVTNGTFKGSSSSETQRAFLAIVEWEQLMAFDQRCSDFKNGLSISERTLMTGEDLMNEKFNRLLVDGRLAQLGTSITSGFQTLLYPVEVLVNQSAKAWSQMMDQTGRNQSPELVAARRAKGIIEFDDPSSDDDDDDDDPSTAEHADKTPQNDVDVSSLLDNGQASMRSIHHQSLDIWRILSSTGSENYCSDLKLIRDKPDAIVKLASAAKAELEDSCRSVEQAIFRKSSWWQSGSSMKADGPMCKCASRDAQVYCGGEAVSKRKFYVREVLQNPSCTLASQPYCAKDARTEEQNLAAKLTALKCHAVAGAVPNSWFHKAECACEVAQHKVFCGDVAVADGIFNMTSFSESPARVLQSCVQPYCASEAHSSVQAMMQLHEQQSSFRDISTAASGTDPLLGALMWLPLQLGGLFKMTTDKALDSTMALWWFAFNNVYGTIGTMEAFEILKNTALMSEKFVQWTGIVTFFIWLVNDAVFTGMNHAMCPRISEWIGLMEGVRPASDKQVSENGLSKLASKDRVGVFGTSCSRTVAEVHHELLDEAKQTYAATAKLQMARRGSASIAVATWEAPQNLDVGESNQTAEILETYRNATNVFQKELAPASLCPIASKVLGADFHSTLGKVVSFQVAKAACECEPRPLECSHGPGSSLLTGH